MSSLFRWRTMAEFCLERSGEAPLDLELDLTIRDEEEDYSDSDAYRANMTQYARGKFVAALPRLFKVLIGEQRLEARTPYTMEEEPQTRTAANSVHRWRTFRMKLPKWMENAQVESTLRCFSFEVPSLEVLRISRGPVALPTKSVFPDSAFSSLSNLKFLETNLPVELDRLRSSMRFIRTLSIPASPGWFWHLPHFPNLCHLGLLLDGVSYATDWPTEVIHLPRLQVLCIHDADRHSPRITALIQAPKLCRLRISTYRALSYPPSQIFDCIEILEFDAKSDFFRVEHYETHLLGILTQCQQLRQLAVWDDLIIGTPARYIIENVLQRCPLSQLKKVVYLHLNEEGFDAAVVSDVGKIDSLAFVIDNAPLSHIVHKHPAKWARVICRRALFEPVHDRGKRVGSLDMNLTLAALPETIIFEICNWLDIFSLVSFSEVNKRLRSLANTQSSFWLGTLSRTDLILPLRGPIAFHEQSAADLNLAAHRATIVERNLASTEAKLHSWRHISWPFELSEGVDCSERESEEVPRDIIKTHVVDESGEWMFFVSARNVIRIIHLRTGKVAAIFDDLYYSSEALLAGGTFKWSVEFFHTDGGLLRARMVVCCVVPEQSNSEDKIVPGIALLDINLDPSRSLATVNLIKRKALMGFPLMLDINGPFVVIIVPDRGSGMVGQVLMYRWVDWTPIKLPQLYPSASCGLREEYLISVGISANNQVFCQVVPYPYKSSTEMTPEGSTLSDEQLSQHLKRRLPLQSYLIPYTGRLWRDGRLPAFRICHCYTGQRYSTIRLCIRPSGDGILSIFSFTFDLVDLTTKAAKIEAANGGDEASFVQHLIAPQESKRVLQEGRLRHCAMSTASGKRYLWWRPVSTPVDSSNPFTLLNQPNASSSAVSGETEGAEPPTETFQLYTSNIDELAPFSEMDSSVLSSAYRLYTTTKYSAGSVSARQLAAVRRLPVPESLACMKGQLFLLLLVEWCGTAIIQLVTGDIWVLRYGKA
ncbi:hypothetical protein FRC17_006786 [Serendipita sp. 399]|nr:hypothetical protein FRC17_006786 [Serendipita sp. 399]